jgi:hypothetical protein
MNGELRGIVQLILGVAGGIILAVVIIGVFHLG